MVTNSQTNNLSNSVNDWLDHVRVINTARVNRIDHLFGLLFQLRDLKVIDSKEFEIIEVRWNDDNKIIKEFLFNFRNVKYSITRYAISTYEGGYIKNFIKISDIPEDILELKLVILNSDFYQNQLYKN